MNEHDLVGSRFGHVRIVGFVGEGGMGSVYLGFDEKLQRRIALKGIREAHLDPERKARFLRETGRTAEARPVADRLFATGYRRRPFVDLCDRSGIRPR